MALTDLIYTPLVPSVLWTSTAGTRFMPNSSNDQEQLNALNLEVEVSLRRARRLVEFMRVVCENEVQILNQSAKEPVQSSEIRAQQPETRAAPLFSSGHR